MRAENTYIPYLSDDELEQLIAEVEQEELVSAPPDMAEHILSSMHENKVREFKAYCLRVVTSVAAAVVLVFALPTVISKKEPAEWTYESREELLGRSSLSEALNGNKIFGYGSNNERCNKFDTSNSTDNNGWHIFK